MNDKIKTTKAKTVTKTEDNSVKKSEVENKNIKVSKETTGNEKSVNTKPNYKSYNKSYGGKRRKKFCKFCAKGIEHVDYKDVDMLKKYLNHHLKIMGARVTGTCSKHQRRLSNSIKRARVVALIPFIIQD